jgi:hypothetical protein
MLFLVLGVEILSKPDITGHKIDVLCYGTDEACVDTQKVTLFGEAGAARIGKWVIAKDAGELSAALVSTTALPNYLLHIQLQAVPAPLDLSNPVLRRIISVKATAATALTLPATVSDKIDYLILDGEFSLNANGEVSLVYFASGAKLGGVAVKLTAAEALVAHTGYSLVSGAIDLTETTIGLIYSAATAKLTQITVGAGTLTLVPATPATAPANVKFVFLADVAQTWVLEMPSPGDTIATSQSFTIVWQADILTSVFPVTPLGTGTASTLAITTGTPGDWSQLTEVLIVTILGTEEALTQVSGHVNDENLHFVTDEITEPFEPPAPPTAAHTAPHTAAQTTAPQSPAQTPIPETPGQTPVPQTPAETPDPNDDDETIPGGASSWNKAIKIDVVIYTATGESPLDEGVEEALKKANKDQLGTFTFASPSNLKSKLAASNSYALILVIYAVPTGNGEDISSTFQYSMM